MPGGTGARRIPRAVPAITRTAREPIPAPGTYERKSQSIDAANR